ncbi:hypothetical protein G5B35_01310 [Parapusillimonas sp. SGNA-6]|nr:hypothetical protein [Parapusillimonas sp. SGNA-6]
MSTLPYSVSRRKRSPYRGSALLASAWQRCGRVAGAVLAMWVLTAWGMGWL